MNHVINLADPAGVQTLVTEFRYEFTDAVRLDPVLRHLAKVKPYERDIVIQMLMMLVVKRNQHTCTYPPGYCPHPFESTKADEAASSDVGR